MNVDYVENDGVEENLRAIRSNTNITADMVDINGKVNYMVHQSSSQYGFIRGAMNNV